MIYILLLVLILLILYIKHNQTESFRNPNLNEYILLNKCFRPAELNTFKKYYNKTDIINIDNGIVFLTPNNIINELPQLTWNGVFLNNLCIDPTKRNQGIGTKLLEQVIKKIKLDGKDHIILQVNNNNKNAIKLYNKHGFIKYTEGLDSDGEKVSFYILYL